MPVERPSFATATDYEMKSYLQACWQWADTRGIDDAERELIKRGHKNYVDYLRDLGPK